MFTLFTIIARQPLLRWLVILAVGAALLLMTTRSKGAALNTNAGYSAQRTSAAVGHTAARAAAKSTVSHAAVKSAVKPSGKQAVAKGAIRHLVVTVTENTSTPRATAKSAAKPTVKRAAAPAKKAPVKISTEPTPPDFSLTTQPVAGRIVQGTAGDIEIKVDARNQFKDSVTFSVAGLPAGVTATFRPSRKPSIYPLYLSANATAPTGPTEITVTGTSGSLTRTAVLKLEILPHPDFSLSAWSTVLPLATNGTATRTIHATPILGFADPIGFAALDLPTGVTASFDPSRSSTGTSTLVLNAGPKAQLGASTITVVGSSHGYSHSWTVQLQVISPHQPDFQLSAWPTDLSVIPGGSTGNTVTILPVEGFSGNVTLSIDGLPQGVTATLMPAITSGSSMLTLRASRDVSGTEATVTITGTTSSGLTRTTTATLSIASTIATASARQ